ncbi:MAG: protein kinase domain-containing protein [Cypionkella sp.]
MAITLTPVQQSFIENYLHGKNRIAKKLIEGEYKDFLGRQAKTQAAIDLLPPGSPDRVGLETRMAAADVKAQAGKFTAAYGDLKSVKGDARRLANGFTSLFSAGSIQTEIALLNVWVSEMIAERDERLLAIEDKFDPALNALRNKNPVSTTASKDEAFARLKSINSEVSLARTQINLRKKEAEVNAAEMKARVEAFGFAARLPDLRHKIDVVGKMAAGSDAPLTQALDAAKARFDQIDQGGWGKSITNRTTPRYTAASEELEKLAKELTDLSNFRNDASLFTDNTGKSLSKAETDAMKKKMATQFAEAEDRDRKRIDDAMTRMETDLQNEKVAMSAYADKGPIRRLERFDSYDMFEAAQDLPKKVDDYMAVPLVKGVVVGIRDELEKLLLKGANNDVLFDVAARSPDDWKKEIETQLGLDLDDVSTDPSIAKLVGDMAQAIFKEVQTAYPNKAAPDMSSFSLNGKTYEGREALGSGGGGVVSIYTDKSTGERIVLKEPLAYNPSDVIADGKFEEFAKEARNHREATGGEKGTPPTNIMGIEGLVLGPNGQPLLAMPLADGGDLDVLSNAINAAKETGLISPQAQNAMVQDAVRQMALGIKQMQDAGISHHDLKEANVFVMKDGTIKIADFGLANLLEDHDDEVSMKAYTPGYQPAEFQDTGKLGEKSDNFTLGVILDKMTDVTHGTSSMEQDEFVIPLTQQQTRAPDPNNPGETETIQATALDRLRNALLSDDPDERPEMTQVLLSSYLYETETAYTKEDLDALRTASNEYARNVGKRTGKIEKEIQALEGQVRLLEQERMGDIPARKAAYFQAMIEKRQRIKVNLTATQIPLQQKLDALTLDLGAMPQKPTAPVIDEAATDQVRKEQKDKYDKDLEEHRKKINSELAKDPILKKKYDACTVARTAVRKGAEAIAKMDREILMLGTRKVKEEQKIGQQRTPVELRNLAQQADESRQEIVKLRKTIDAIHDEPAAKVYVDQLKKANEAFQ